MVTIALAGSALAQEAGDETVTGSHLRLKDPGGASPVVVFDRERIRLSGIVSIGDFLQQMPEQGGALNTNVNNGGDGETTLSLRNLGAQRTLVLVDGKRWVNGGSGPGSFVDLNSIPSASIERVEVLKDGASAVYGSDAIAGVVNIITRRRMNGIELGAYGGMSPHGDAQQYDVSALGGVANDKGSFLLGGGYFNQKAMFAGNRDWAAYALTYDYSKPDGDPNQVTKGGSPTIPNGRAAVNLNACNGNALCNQLSAAYHAALACPATGSCSKTFIFDNTSSPCASGFVASATTDFTSCQIGNWRPMVGLGLNKQNGATNDLYNFQAANYLITPSQRIQLFSNGDFNISNSARAYFQGSFVNRQSETKLASEPLSIGAFGARLNTDNFYNPFGNPTDPACAGNATTAGCGQSVSAARRMVEAGGRSTGFDLDTVRAVAGFDGTLPEELGPLRGVSWDVSFTYGRTWGTTTNNGSVNTSATANALGSTNNNTGTPGCGTSANPIAGCTPANLFGPTGSVTPEMLSSLGFYTGISSGWTELVDAQANFNAPLFQLASERPVGLAGGWEYRQMYGVFVPDPIANAGNSFDFNSLPTKGSYHLNEGYLELHVPVVSHAALAEELELQAAIRGYQYSNFGGGAVYKLGGLWRPVHGLTLRGSWSTNIREPNLSELYLGHQPSAEAGTDPCAFASPGTPLGQRCAFWSPKQGGPADFPVVCNDDCFTLNLNSTVGGNPALHPEKAYAATVGVVIEPAALPGFSAEAGYYNLKVTQTIGAVGTQNILDGCYFHGNDAYCALITREPATGQITNVSDLQTNVGVTQTAGVDFALRYTVPTDFGRFGFLFDSTYLIYFRQTLPSGATISAAGNYDLGSGTATGSLTPKLKFNAGINYALAGLTAGLRARYIGGFDECAGFDGSSASSGLCSLPVDSSGNPVAQSPYPPHQVPAYVTFDVVVSYTYRTHTTVAVGMRNVFDSNPPNVYNETFIFTDPGYDLAGRFLYARVGQTF